MRRNSLSEKDFLKLMALNHFNNQFGTKLDIKNFDICSIRPAGCFYRLAYEITSIEVTDTFKIHMYLNISRADNMSPYILKVGDIPVNGALGDEIFVTTGSIDSGHHLYGGYPFQPLFYEIGKTPILLDALFESILLADGGFIYIN